MDTRNLVQLPKEEVRRRLSGRDRRTILRPELPPAAVLLLLAGATGQYRIILTKRTNRVEHHKGEISFAGGVRDPEDTSLEQTALREAYEEIGVQLDDVEVLGQIDDIVTRSNIHVTPFVGSLPFPYAFKPFETEVAEILAVPVTHLLAPENIVEETRTMDGKPFHLRSYRYGEHLIFGATAIMLRQFLHIVFSAPA